MQVSESAAPRFSCVPLRLDPYQRLGLNRCEVVPGVKLSVPSRALRRVLDSMASPRASFHASHVVLIDIERYTREVRRRIESDGNSAPPADDLRWPGAATTIGKQVLIALILLQRFRFIVGGGDYSLELEAPGRYRCTSVGVVPIEEVSYGVVRAIPTHPRATIDPKRLKRIASLLDRYYRGGVWHVDRMAVALSSLWAGLCTPFLDQAFLSFTTVLEALLSDGGTEITHKLAERAAVLVGTTGKERMTIYDSVKHVYEIRSRLVHGRVHVSRGHIGLDSFHIDAKKAIVPISALEEVGRLMQRLVLAVLLRADLIGTIQKRQSEDKTTKALNELFLRQTLG